MSNLRDKPFTNTASPQERAERRAAMYEAEHGVPVGTPTRIHVKPQSLDRQLSRAEVIGELRCCIAVMKQQNGDIHVSIGSADEIQFTIHAGSMEDNESVQLGEAQPATPVEAPGKSTQGVTGSALDTPIVDLSQNRDAVIAALASVSTAADLETLALDEQTREKPRKTVLDAIEARKKALSVPDDIDEV